MNLSFLSHPMSINPVHTSFYILLALDISPHLCSHTTVYPAPWSAPLSTARGSLGPPICPLLSVFPGIYPESVKDRFIQGYTPRPCTIRLLWPPNLILPAVLSLHPSLLPDVLNAHWAPQGRGLAASFPWNTLCSCSSVSCLLQVLT